MTKADLSTVAAASAESPFMRVPARTLSDVYSKALPKSPQFCIIYHEEIGAMLDAMGCCMRCFTVGTDARE